MTSKKITFHRIFWHETPDFSGDFPALLFGDFYKLWPQIDPHHLIFSLVWSFDWVFPPTPYWIYNKREWQVRRVVTGKFVADGSFVGSNYPQKIENELCFVVSKPSKASSLSMHWNPESGAKALEFLISQLMIKIQANPSKNNEGKTSVEFSMYTFDISSTLVLD